MKAWVPRSKDAPHYFITFIKPDGIERLAPLRVVSRPETVIRVLMDYRPLDRALAAPPPTLARPPRRKGFTVVEWGGLIRQSPAVRARSVRVHPSRTPRHPSVTLTQQAQAASRPIAGGS